MMLKEFVDLTGYTPSYEEYKEIEDLYYRFDGDKKSFCKAWAKLYGFKIKDQEDRKIDLSMNALARRLARFRNDDPKATKILKVLYKIACRYLAALDSGNALFIVDLGKDEPGILIRVRDEENLYGIQET